MAGYLGNNVLPARAGELIRAIYVGKENNISFSFTLATGLVERFMDLIALVIIGSIALASAGIISDQIVTPLKVISVIALAGLGGILIAPYLGNKLTSLVSSLPGVNHRVKERVGKFLKQFFRGVEALHHLSRAGMFILFTSIIWAMDGVGVVILARSLHLEITLTQSFLLLAGLGLSSAIPSTPGYVGVYQFVAVTILKPFGIANTDSLALIIFLQAANLLLVVFWGWLGISRASVFIGTSKNDNL